MQEYSVVIIGTGPAGLSAAARAHYHASRDESFTYLVLEAFDKPAKTIQMYQKGKLVMAEPGFLSLRSDLNFSKGSREEVLGTWQEELENLGVKLEFNAEVISISGEQGRFILALKSGEEIIAADIILAIGIEGNPRKLGVPGEDLPAIQYSLNDPEAISGETVIVVGAGDSAIENALALAKQNNVMILNRREEFSRAKEGNLNALLKANNNEKISLTCAYSTTVKNVETKGSRYLATLQNKQGDVQVECDRLICRLGAVPPRRFLESIDIQFPSAAESAVPELNAKYESNIPGVYIIGSLGGYPLIKQAMNQGYDVIEFIRGNDIKSADYPLLKLQFQFLPYRYEADQLARLFQKRVPMFSQLSSLQFRELLIESTVFVSYSDSAVYEEMLLASEEVGKKLSKYKSKPRFTKVIPENTQIITKGDFSTFFYTIVDGSVDVISGSGQEKTLDRGDFFGESSLLSGRANEESVVAKENMVLVATPRRTMLKLMNSNEGVKAGVDLVYIMRTIQKQIAPNVDRKSLSYFAQRAELMNVRAGEQIFSEGEDGREIYIIRSGSINIYRSSKDKNILVSQHQAGSLLGEAAVMGSPKRRESAIASVSSELVKLNQKDFVSLLGMDRSQVSSLQRVASSHSMQYTEMEVRPENGALVEFMMDKGVGEATNCFVISESLCIGCDNCEKACADTHGGISRVNREQGPSFRGLHIPITCRHCEQPHCMKDCPPDALRRSSDGEVYVDDSCIGCGNCVANCPYDAIKLAYEAPKKPGLFKWLLFGAGSGPGEVKNYIPTPESIEKGKKAVKCDACVNLSGGPACVNACPTGAAARISPDQFIKVLELQ